MDREHVKGRGALPKRLAYFELRRLGLISSQDLVIWASAK